MLEASSADVNSVFEFGDEDDALLKLGGAPNNDDDDDDEDEETNERAHQKVRAASAAYGWCHCFGYTVLIAVTGLPIFTILATRLLDIIFPYLLGLARVSFLALGIVAPLLQGWRLAYYPASDLDNLLGAALRLNILQSFLSSDAACIVFALVVRTAAGFATPAFALLKTRGKPLEHMVLRWSRDGGFHKLAAFGASSVLLVCCFIGVGLFLWTACLLLLILLRKLYNTGHKLQEIYADMSSSSTIARDTWLLLAFVIIRASLVCGTVECVIANTKSGVIFGSVICLAIRVWGFLFFAERLVKYFTLNEEVEAPTRPAPSVQLSDISNDEE